MEHQANKSIFYPYGRLVIVPTGLILFIILFVLGLILYGFQLLQAGGLNEHSLCSQYNQASETAQMAITSTMLTNHGSSMNADVEHISVNAFCAGSPSQPIDGVLTQFDQNP